MIRVTTIYAQSANAGYYTNYLTKAPGEVPGVWKGAQAGLLGLSGEVSTEALELLLSGHDPVSGAQLGSPLIDRTLSSGKVIRAVAGFDATVSSPKSLSAWWALTGDHRLLDCHDIAVDAVVGYLERFGSTTRVRSNGSRLHPESLGLTVAAFRQTTSREDDPQLHTHLVISAKVQTIDGRWLALDARFLKRHQRTLGGLYQSVLRAELTTRFGVGFTEIVNGQADIAGIPEELIEQFSKRTAQVDVELAAKVAIFVEREGRDPTRWERAALTREAAADTRAHKTGNGVADLRTRWRAEAAPLGMTPESLVAGIVNAAYNQASVAAATVGDVIDRLSASGSVWHRADIVRALCDLQRPFPNVSGERWMAMLDGAVDRVLDHCINLDPDHGPSASRRAADGRSVWVEPVAPHVTSERILAQEEQILTWALDNQSDDPNPSTTINSEALDVLQADAAAAVAGADRLVLVVGPAGTGKTTMLAAGVDDLHRQRREVFGVAPTAKAARVLERDTRMIADTLAKLLHEWTQPDRPPGDTWRLPRGASIVVDEAGMLGTANLAELIRLADDQQWRLILVGDPHQLQAVGRGGLFNELTSTGRTIELQHVHRFTEPWEAAASLKLRHGNPHALDDYQRHERIIPGTLDEHLDTIADHWRTEHARGVTTAITTTTNAHVDRINTHIQGVRIDRGELDPHRWAIIAGGHYAHEGDVIATRRNDRHLHTDRGDTVRNRELWTVTQIGDTGDLTVTHNGGHGTVTLPADYVREHVRLGYAATEHGNQADTVTTSLTLATPAITGRGLYVAMTRGRQDNLVLVITDTHDITEARDVLDGILASDRADIPAVTQRRNLAQQHPPTRPMQPRCEVPDWFPELRHDLTDRFEATRRELDDGRTRREQLAAHLHLAEHRLQVARAAATPHLAALDSSRTAVAATDDTRRSAARTLADTHRLARRPAKEALDRSEHRHADALRHQKDVSDAAAPTLRELNAARLALSDAQEHLHTLGIVDQWDHRPAQVDMLGRGHDALARWHHWATGASGPAGTSDGLTQALRQIAAVMNDGRYIALADAVHSWGRDPKRMISLDPHPRVEISTAEAILNDWAISTSSTPESPSLGLGL